MPVKRKKKIAIDPWDTIPNFDEEKDFQLIIEAEDSFGNRKRMQLDDNMKLVPIKQDKENMSNMIVQNKKVAIDVRSPVIVLSNVQKNKNLIKHDEDEFTSPVKVRPLISKNCLNENNKIEKKIAVDVTCPLIVLSDIQNNINFMKHDENKFTSPVTGRQLISKNCLIENNKVEIKPKKGILKNVIIVEQDIPENHDSLSDTMMISSPIVQFTPRGKGQMHNQRKMLLDKLKNMNETPILASKVNEERMPLNSLDLIGNQDDGDSFHANKDQSISHTVPQQNLLFVKRDSASDDLFSDHSPVNLTNSHSEEHISDKIDHPNVRFQTTNKSDFYFEDTSFQIVDAKDKKRWLQLAKRRSRLIKQQQGLTDSFWHMYNVEDSLSVILKLCQVSSVQAFAKVFPQKVRKEILKLGEGSFGEVFMLKNVNNEDVVVKFIPVDGDVDYNGAPMTKFEDVVSEIVIAKELSDLSMSKLNRCLNYVQMSPTNSVSVCRGRFPSYFQSEWDKSNAVKKSENDNPKTLGSQQHWIVLQFQFSGSPLEDFDVRNWQEAHSILTQVAVSLACAENEVEFEHRDLHLGNVLVLRTGEREEDSTTFIVGGKDVCVRLCGVKATIIDFTFSRIDKEENTVYIDLSKDKDLFLGSGDPQFDVYREMQAHNGDDWRTFNPKTNILWLKFLGLKLLDKVAAVVKGDQRQAHAFRGLVNSVSSFGSCDDFVRGTFANERLQ